MKKGELAFKDLKVWWKAIDFADQIIDLIDQFDSDRKHYRIIEQLEAAASSIGSNVAEGKGRYSKKEFVQYLYIARGSLYETISLLNICNRRAWISQEQLQQVEAQGLELAQMIKGLINSIYESK
jgi:four helix bundle protein